LKGAFLPLHYLLSVAIPNVTLKNKEHDKFWTIMAPKGITTGHAPPHNRNVALHC